MAIDSYVINLDRRPDRLDRFYANYPAKYKRPTKFTALDGQLVPDRVQFESPEMKIVYEQLRSLFGRQTLKQGEFGCWVSHVTLWYKLAMMPGDHAWIIYEDDAQFQENFTENMDSALQFLQQNIQEGILLYLGGGPFQMKPFESSQFVAGFPICQTSPFDNVCQHAQALTSSMARILIDDLWHGPINQNPVDIHLNKFFAMNPKFRQQMNPLIVQSNPLTIWKSDIQGIRDRLFKMKFV